MVASREGHWWDRVDWGELVPVVIVFIVLFGGIFAIVTGFGEDDEEVEPTSSTEATTTTTLSGGGGTAVAPTTEVIVAPTTTTFQTPATIFQHEGDSNDVIIDEYQASNGDLCVVAVTYTGSVDVDCIPTTEETSSE